MPIDPNDPRLAGLTTIEQFRLNDADHTSRTIRDILPGGTSDCGCGDECDEDRLPRVQFRIELPWLQFKHTDELPLEWKNVLDLRTLKGDPGDVVQMRFQDPWVQYKFPAEPDTAWKNLFQPPRGLKGDQGDGGLDAYALAKGQGFVGTLAQWLASLVGPKGDKGDSAYRTWILLGNVGSEQDFIASLKGEKGDKGEDGEDATGGEYQPSIVHLVPAGSTPASIKAIVDLAVTDARRYGGTQVEVRFADGAYAYSAGTFSFARRDLRNLSFLNLSPGLKVGSLQVANDQPEAQPGVFRMRLTAIPGEALTRPLVANAWYFVDLEDAAEAFWAGFLRYEGYDAAKEEWTFAAPFDDGLPSGNATRVTFWTAPCVLAPEAPGAIEVGAVHLEDALVGEMTGLAFVGNGTGSQGGLVMRGRSELVMGRAGLFSIHGFCGYMGPATGLGDRGLGAARISLGSRLLVRQETGRLFLGCSKAAGLMAEDGGEVEIGFSSTQWQLDGNDPPGAVKIPYAEPVLIVARNNVGILARRAKVRGQGGCLGHATSSYRALYATTGGEIRIGALTRRFRGSIEARRGVVEASGSSSVAGNDPTITDVVPDPNVMTQDGSLVWIQAFE